MKIIHTSDWHVGCTLDYYDRTYEHRCFFNFLTDTIRNENADALIVAGDIFDSANPTSDSQKFLNEFLVSLIKSFPNLQIILTGGNHDSASRLAVNKSLFELFNVHVVSRLEIDEHNDPALEKLIFPLTDKDYKICAYCAALPFIRRADIPVGYAQEESYHKDSFVNSLYKIHKKLFELMKAKAVNGEKLIIMDHTTVQGGSVNEDEAEHQIVIGTVESIDVDMYEGFDYAALGHIHAHQNLGKTKPVVYSGSPIPLSFSEKHYKHGVEIIDIDGANNLTVRHELVPRVVDFKTIPEEHLPLPEVLEYLKKLPKSDLLPENYPFVEIQYLADKFEPRIGEKIKDAIKGKKLRFVKIKKISREKTEQSAEQRALANTVNVQELNPGEIFEMFYRSQADGHDAPEEMKRVFISILDEVRQQEKSGV